MPRTCTICSHPDRASIDAALVTGAPYRRIAAQFSSITEQSVRRHKEHVADAISDRAEAHALDVVKQLKTINGVTLAILGEARTAGDAGTALKAIDRIQRQIELQAKLLGDLDERPQVNVLIMPEWLTIRTALLHALADYPEARLAVVAALEVSRALA